MSAALLFHYFYNLMVSGHSLAKKHILNIMISWRNVQFQPRVQPFNSAGPSPANQHTARVNDVNEDQWNPAMGGARENQTFDMLTLAVGLGPGLWRVRENKTRSLDNPPDRMDHRGDRE